MTALATTPSLDLDSLDHLVLHVASLATSTAFYVDVLGLQPELQSADRAVVRLGDSRIELRRGTDEDVRGGTRICLVTRMPVEGVLRLLAAHDITAQHGPVDGSSAGERVLSVFVRDPDGNLIELANRLEGS